MSLRNPCLNMAQSIQPRYMATKQNASADTFAIMEAPSAVEA